MSWRGEPVPPNNQRFGAHAVLFGEIVEPVYTLLGELRTPFI